VTRIKVKGATKLENKQVIGSKYIFVCNVEQN